MGNAQVQPPERPFCDLGSQGQGGSPGQEGSPGQGGSPGQEGILVVQLYLMPAFFLVVLILGLPLNLLSLWIFSHRLRRWTRSTVLLFNLTLADTSWLLALPFLVQYHLDHLYWGLGLPLCKAVRLLYHNYFYLSIVFVTLISVDRYIAIVHPLRSLALRGRRQTALLCVTVWACTLLLSIPVANMSLTQKCPVINRTVCTLYILLKGTEKSLPYSIFCSVAGFLFPLVSICYCCLRSVRELRRRPQPHGKQRRLTRVLSAVLILFALLYLPYHLSRNAAILMRAVYPDRPDSWQPTDLAFTLEMCLCSLNTCTNPLFSCFMGRQFRSEFHGTFAVLFSQCPRVGCFSSWVSPQRTRRTVAVVGRRGPGTVTPLCVLTG